MPWEEEKIDSGRGIEKDSESEGSTMGMIKSCWTLSNIHPTLSSFAES